MRKIGIVIGCFLLIASVIIYSYLGGFNKPVITVEEVTPFSVYGYAYEGQLGSRQFGKLFRNADSLVDNQLIEGKVTGVFYNQPDNQNDTVRTFVGVLSPDSLFVEVEKREYNPGKVVQAVIKANYLVLPVNIYPKIIKFARENNIELSEQSFEIYEQEDLLKILIPVGGGVSK